MGRCPGILLAMVPDAPDGRTAYKNWGTGLNFGKEELDSLSDRASFQAATGFSYIYSLFTHELELT